MKHAHPHRQTEGFTIVVMAALFVAFTVMAAVAVERNTTLQQISRRNDTRDQLTRLSNAIIEYSVFNKVGTSLQYPCPAATNQSVSSPSFGTGVNNGSSQDCSTAAHVAEGIVILTPGTDVVRGMVPVQTLSPYGISLNDAFDPWNNRIMYVVNRQLTMNGSNAQANNPTMVDPMHSAGGSGTPLIPNPDFILISYGRDGVGSLKRGNDTGIPEIGGGVWIASTIFRFANCDTDTAFYSMPSYTASNAEPSLNSVTLYPSPRAYFDDILSFYRQ